jgi:oligoendopeptidase F
LQKGKNMSLPTTTTRWSLKDLYSDYDSADLQAALEEIETRVSDFESYRPMLEVDIPKDAFMKIVKDLEQIHRLAALISSFAGLRFAEDTQDQVAQSFQARIDQLMATIQNRILFFSLWWKELEDDQAGRLMADSGDYHYWLEEMRHFKPHTLSEPEEKIINIKNVTGVRAFNNLYDSITNRYTFKLQVDGKQKELTRGEVMVYVRHTNPDLRAQAYQELYRVYGDDGSILGQIYQTLARDWRNEHLDLRKFPTPISARNLYNDIPNEVVDTLLEVCQNNAPVFQKYFRLKARRLKMDRLRRYDIYAPVVKSSKEYSHDRAAQMVLASFDNFDPRFSTLAQRVFDDGHLDSQVRKGKRGGAFCWTATPDLTPWVLLNFQGRPDDVATMAHELGHAIHSMLASDHNVFTAVPSLPLAETASTFGEMLLVDRLLAREQDEAVRLDLLFRQVDDAYATIMRQAYFALFERQAHAMVKEGASVDELSKAYMENLQQQFGEAVELSDEFRWEWVSIPHIYQVPFYVYAYAFGQLLVLSLYQQFQEEGEAFKPRYLRILSAGGSEAPVRILSEAGINVYKPEFWQGGFDVVREMVEELEQIS